MLDATRVRDSLRHLSVSRPNAFGAGGHRFLLNPPLAEADVLAFERSHNVGLPAEYRHFLTAVGNGGAGPYYGVFPLGKMDGLGDSIEPWTEGFIGVLAEPFLFTDEWNELQEMPSDELLRADKQEYERRLDQFERRYWGSSMMNGAIPICHEGCALRVWLVVTGSQAGHLWRDGRSDYSGLKPLLLADGSRATFSTWYSEWLEEALRQVS